VKLHNIVQRGQYVNLIASRKGVVVGYGLDDTGFYSRQEQLTSL